MRAHRGNMCSATLEFLAANVISSIIELGVYPKLSDCKRFVNLDYDQIEAKNGHTVVEECRGLVISKPHGETFSDDLMEKGEFQIVARPMRRFYHFESAFAPSLEVSSVFVMEKLDGSCIKVWWNPFDNEWRIGTRGTSTANIKIGGMHKDSEFTFTTLFKQVVKDFELFTQELDKTKTYVFELCSLYNQVVVAYPESFITLLAVIETAIGKEENIWNLPDSQFYNKVKRFSLSSKEEMFKFLLEQDPSKFEGFVLMDKHHNRAKCKHPGYENLNGLKTALNSYRNILSLILMGKLDDVLPLVSGEIEKECLRLQEAVRVFIHNGEHVWLNAPKFESRKDFALWCKENKLNISLFVLLYEKKVESFKDAVVNNPKTRQPNGEYSSTFLDGLYNAI